MRKDLRQARLAKELTIEQVAEHLGIVPDSYRNIEWGYRNTKPENWDNLEDLLEQPQRQLRVNIKSPQKDKQQI